MADAIARSLQGAPKLRRGPGDGAPLVAVEGAVRAVPALPRVSTTDVRPAIAPAGRGSGSAGPKRKAPGGPFEASAPKRVAPNAAGRGAGVPS